MADISKCTGVDCPIRESCYRFLAPANPFAQAYYNYKYKENCEGYWERGQNNNTIKT